MLFSVETPPPPTHPNPSFLGLEEFHYHDGVIINNSKHIPLEINYQQHILVGPPQGGCSAGSRTSCLTGSHLPGIGLQPDRVQAQPAFKARLWVLSEL